MILTHSSNQTKLTTLYQRFLDREAICRACGSVEDVEKFTNEIDGPFLIKTNEEYEESNPRVVIVGQETNGWLTSYKAFLDNKTAIEGALSVYEAFDFGKTYKSPFLQYFHRTRTGIFGTGATDNNRRAVLWLNLFKFCHISKDRSMMRSKHKATVLQLQGNVFQQEVAILKPDVCIFLTCPYYDEFIRGFYPGITFQPMPGFSERQVALLAHEQLPPLSFRTYHPGYLNRFKSRTEKYLPAIVQRVTDAFAAK
jgi:hypothetical protein